MIGGLLTAGALTSAGASVTTAALAGGETVETVEGVVVQHLATAIARKSLGLLQDNGPWLALCELESQIASELQRLEPYCDPGASVLKTLQKKASSVRRAIEYLIDHELALIIPK
jgi:hypothetical protein